MDSDRTADLKSDDIYDASTDDKRSEDDILEDIASGKISGCQAFRTLASSVKKDTGKTEG